MNLRIAFLIAGLTLCGASLATGQERITTPYRFFEHTQAAGLFAAQISTDQGQLGLGPESGTAFGGRYHIRLGGPFFLEAEVMYFSTTRAVRDTAVVDSAFEKIGEAETGLINGLASLRFNITGQRTWHRLLPFIVLGAGLTHEIQDDEDADEAVPSESRFDFGTTFAGQLGGGIEWVPVDRLAVRIDARSILWQIKAPDGLLAHGLSGRALPEDEWVNNFTISAGVSFHF